MTRQFLAKLHPADGRNRMDRRLVVGLSRKAGSAWNVRRTASKGGPGPCRRTGPDPAGLMLPGGRAQRLQRITPGMNAAPGSRFPMIHGPWAETHDKVSAIHTQAPDTKKTCFCSCLANAGLAAANGCCNCPVDQESVQANTDPDQSGRTAHVATLLRR